MGRTSQCELHHDAILAMNNQGLLRQHIADRLGLTKTAVQAYLQRRGIPMARETWGKPPLLDRARLQDLLEQGLTQQQIADVLQCSCSTVERSAQRMRLQTARTGPRAGASHRQQWSGGRIVEKGWYIGVHAPLHPYAKKSGYCSEHRLVLEVALGRYLLPREVVDHLDSHPQHNWPGNLALYASNADHLKATLTGREKSSLVRLQLGDLPSSRKNVQTPGLHDTLALCPAEIRTAYERHVLIHRPGPQHAHLAKQTLLRSGPTHPAFQRMSTG